MFAVTQGNPMSQIKKENSLTQFPLFWTTSIV